MQTIRVVVIDGAPWFSSADVLGAFGYPRGSRTYRLNQLGTDERRVWKIETPRGAQEAVLVSESGLYKLVMWGSTPAAGPFQEWVTREVLPAIRKTGGYRLQGVAPEAVQEGTASEMPETACVRGRSVLPANKPSLIHVPLLIQISAAQTM